LLLSTDLVELEIEVQWMVDGLIVKKAINLLFGPGGVGKTWNAVQIGKAVSEESYIWGRKTIWAPVVYVDLENPLPILKQRFEKIGTSQNFYIWHLSNEAIPPPMLDGPDWEKYRFLPPESLVIFDTLRAVHRGEENSSEHMALVMGRLKQLREMGMTILLLHHTGKAGETIYKGSTAISDLCDHTLCLERLKEDSLELEGQLFKLETKEKTRFLPSKIHLMFEDCGFREAEDPLKKQAQELHSIMVEMPSLERYQATIVKKAEEEFGSGAILRR